MDFNSDYNLPLSKFESMLKTNRVLFFDSDEFENIIHHYLDLGKIPLARKAIKLGLEQHPASVNLQLFQIEILILENDFEKATSMLDELQELDPFNEEILIQKASIYSKQDEHEKAIELLNKALSIGGEPTDINTLIGMEYLFLDQFEDAKRVFMKCLEDDEDDYSALYNIIYCFDYLEQHHEAINYLNTFLDNNPYSEIAWHQIGKQYLELKLYNKALAAFDFAIISDDTFVGAYIEKGKVLERLKRYNEAIESYAISLELEDPTSFALLRIGRCYERLKNPDLALQYYYKTVHEDPLLDKGWIYITKFYYRAKNFNKALYYINKAINIDENNVKYWKLYAKINEKLNFLEEAERGYKRTLELGNYELSTWLTRSDILLKIGEPQAALFNCIQALEFYPEDPEIEFRLAGLYILLSETDKGIYHLNNALSKNKEFTIILDELFPEVLKKSAVKTVLKSKK